jgi:hypothetical protein
MRRHRTKPVCMVRRRSTVRFRNGAPKELPARPGQKLTGQLPSYAVNGSCCHIGRNLGDRLLPMSCPCRRGRGLPGPARSGQGLVSRGVGWCGPQCLTEPAAGVPESQHPKPLRKSDQTGARPGDLARCPSPAGGAVSGFERCNVPPVPGAASGRRPPTRRDGLRLLAAARNPPTWPVTWDNGYMSAPQVMDFRIFT